MQNLLDDLKTVLSADPSLTADGELLKNVVIERAAKLDGPLLKRLLGSEPLRRHFFTDIEGVLVFDKVRFQEFVANKAFLPDSYTAFANRIGLHDGEGYLGKRSEVVLAWPYKDCVLEGGQTKEDAKRDEVFWNTTLAPDDITRLFEPKVLTGFERWDAEAVKKGKPKRVDRIDLDKDNLLIKGNNLLVLHSLKARYAGQVDVIYIDPPYNPPSAANTFRYNNRFNHSSWLTFMRNRLDVAKTLLKREGSLIIAIDDNEFFYLGVLVRELFPDHEVHCIVIVHNPRGVQGTNFSYTHEFAYFIIPRGRRSIGSRKIAAEEVDWAPLRNWGTESERTDAKNCFYPIIVDSGEVVGFGEVTPDAAHPRQTEVVGEQYHVYPIDKKGVERKWRYARQSVESIRHLLRVVPRGDGFDIELGKDFGLQRTVWQDTRYDANSYGAQLLGSLAPECEFSYPKSLWTVYDCLAAVIGNKQDALVLDFFGGSGTTGHAVIELNRADEGSRRYILSEQLDYIQSCTKARLLAVMAQCSGAGVLDLVYADLTNWNERLAKEIQKTSDSAALRRTANRLREEGYVRPGVELDRLSQEGFAALSLKDQKAVLLECLDANHLYVNYGDMADAAYGISEADQAVNRAFYEGED